ncbi:hypothetical protein, partial [Paenibacillus sp. OSY-SE]|uniref:hypothetical protein n=1 Tax=Paenibacillus sp. OSY-SE TaxID=1196323 RepID=UPI00056B8395
MGIKYVSNDVEDKVRTLLTFCQEHDIETDFYEIDDDDCCKDEENIVGNDFEINISLPHTEDFEETTIEEFYDLERVFKP